MVLIASAACSCARLGGRPFIAVYAAFLGEAGESRIIDIRHRHTASTCGTRVTTPPIMDIVRGLLVAAAWRAGGDTWAPSRRHGPCSGHRPRKMPAVATCAGPLYSPPHFGA